MPAITSYYGAFQDSKHIYIVMEYCARGDLLERLLNEGRAFSEVQHATRPAQSRTSHECCFIRPADGPAAVDVLAS